MVLCLPARTASITRPSASSRRLKRSVIHPKGGFGVRISQTISTNDCCSAKYIEGLENRLGRMETLLKLSGLLNDEDGGRTDLGTLEKRLQNQGNRSNADTPDRSSKSGSQPRTVDSQHCTPQLEKMPTPKSPIASLESPKEKEVEVEELSDMMCSLVTNNCGETRYIGMSYG